MHEAGRLESVVDLLDSETLAGEHGGDADLLAMRADSPAWL
jgi:hypothetical protein